MAEPYAIRRALAHYDLGELIDCTCIQRESPQCQKCHHLRMAKGEFFLKRYASFGRSKHASFNVMRHLADLGYPSVRFIPTRMGHPYIQQMRGASAIFEYLHQGEQQKATGTESREIGRSLARLHNLTADFPLHPSDDIQRFQLSFERNKEKVLQAPEAFKPYFKYIDSNINGLNPPPNASRAVCHGEFTLQHVRFENEKLVKVVDWDNVGRDFAILDIGTALTDALNIEDIDFDMIRSILNGYEEERQLTEWEREHIFEATQFGAFKFAIWALENIEHLGWKRFARRLAPIFNYDRTRFIEQLSLGNS